jgi:hypothetical protein
MTAAPTQLVRNGFVDHKEVKALSPVGNVALFPWDSAKGKSSFSKASQDPLGTRQKRQCTLAKPGLLDLGRDCKLLLEGGCRLLLRGGCNGVQLRSGLGC